jgi:hypothetical protein
MAGNIQKPPRIYTQIIGKYEKPYKELYYGFHEHSTKVLKHLT